MERGYIEYKGISYPAAEIGLSKITGEETGLTVTVADIQLWEDMKDDFERGDAEAASVDEGIFFYCESGVITFAGDEDEVAAYVREAIS